MKTIYRNAVALGTFALLSGGNAAHAITFVNYYASNATLNTATNGAGVVGYGNAADLLTFKNGVSPTLNVAPSGSLSGPLSAYNNSVINMSGGSVGSIAAYNNSVVNISGGNVGLSLTVSDNSALNLFGSGLTAKLIANLAGTAGYQVSGTLADGAVLKNETLLVKGTGASFALKNAAATPEPGSMALVFGMASVGVSVLRRRRATA